MRNLQETSSILNNSKHWRERAEEALVQAEQMNSPATREQMLQIAADYLKLAEHADARARRLAPNN